MGAIPQLKQYNLVFLRDQIAVLYFSLFTSTIYLTFVTLLLCYTLMTLAYMSKLQKKKKKDLKSLMNRQVEIANCWMKANKLKINATKSSALVITSGAKTATQKPKILCDGLPIAVISNVKYLGPWIDKNLKFDIHLKFVERKIACAVGILNKSTCYFSKEILLQLYHALIYPHLLYAVSIWGSTYKSYIRKISILQKQSR